MIIRQKWILNILKTWYINRISSFSLGFFFNLRIWVYMQHFLTSKRCLNIKRININSATFPKHTYSYFNKNLQFLYIHNYEFVIITSNKHVVLNIHTPSFSFSINTFFMATSLLVWRSLALKTSLKIESISFL